MMNILIVDDEAPARARLRRLLEDYPQARVVGEAGNGEEALNRVGELQPDVVLLDIRMPGMDGLEAARHLAQLEKPPAVIFTTAFSDYALEAFDAQAVDYLLKPVRKERLEAALQRARQVTPTQITAVNEQAEIGSVRTHISARHRGGLLLVPIDDVLFFHADQKYVTVYHTGGEVLIEDSLKSLETEFGDQVLRIHRNALVMKRALVGMERSLRGQFHVILKDSEERPEISRRHVSTVKRALQNL